MGEFADLGAHPRLGRDSELVRGGFWFSELAQGVKEEAAAAQPVRLYALGQCLKEVQYSFPRIAAVGLGYRFEPLPIFPAASAMYAVTRFSF